MPRSLTASIEGGNRAKTAFCRKYTSQQSCATFVGCTRQVVGQFLRREPVQAELFQSICSDLGLDWNNIVLEEADLGTDTQQPVQDTDLDEIVQSVLHQVSENIQQRCGTMRVLDMAQPIDIDSIYTSVNILEKISRNQRFSVEELQERCEVEDFDRFSLGKFRQERIPALEAVERNDKLMILGKPGAGKTTFLKWLALRCNKGGVFVNQVPFFITLKEFAETRGQPNLFDFIAQQLTACGVVNPEEKAKKILQAGRAIVLLDGLDEVKAQDHDRVLDTIRRTEEGYYTSQFVITCRIAAKEYLFEKFTEVEVADFNSDQIADFVRKWFQKKDLIKAAEFPKELEADSGLQELATNPLLLTLLCLVFEESGRFPTNRPELYKEGLDVLLKKWDAKRNIKREEVYKQLSLQRKEDLLSQIAYKAFEQSNYLFKKIFVEEQIRDYICNLPNASTESVALELDSEAILNAIEAHHGLLVERARGIYSFSHLTFQEYFTARWFKEKADGNFGELICHITDKQWREVFLLTVGMLKNADNFLQGMKQKTDAFLAPDERLQFFLDWVKKKSDSIESSNKPATFRAYYFSFDLDLDLDLTIDFDLGHDFDHALDCALARALDRALAIDFDLDRARALNRALARALDFESTNLQQLLQQLKDRLPNLSLGNYSNFDNWWKNNGREWVEELRAIMIEHRNIGHDWQFSKDQGKLLHQYYDANKLLVDCLNSDCYVSREVREEIESNMLLPVS